MFEKIYRRLRYGKPLVVVSGLPRSGTSMAMKMLEAGGMNPVTDNNRTADIDNPKGYYEDDRVMRLHEEDGTWLADARGKAIKIISYLLPHLPPTNNYKIIFMRRHFDEVLASQKKMLERRGETDDTPDEQMVKNYKDHLHKVNVALRMRPQFESLDIDYAKALEDPRDAALRIRAFLGLPLDVEKMAAVVDDRLYRNRAKDAS